MAYYLVRARLKPELASHLRARLNSGEIGVMRPFGPALHGGLDNARRDGEWIVWEEEDYCSPPLAMERAAVLDTYFTELSVEAVQRDSGWARIRNLPRLWPQE
jgi:hypothetical protein